MLSRQQIRSAAKGKRTQRACHHLVGKTAEELAGAWYEDVCHDNQYHKLFVTLFPGPTSQKDFIRTCWGEFVPLARAILAKMLSNSLYPDAMKNEIAEALILDRTLPRRENIVQTHVISDRIH
jgi:hypothetical protein